MKRKIMAILIIAMFLTTSTIVVSAGKVTMSDTSEPKSLLAVSDSEVILTTGDIEELETALEELEDPVEIEALQAVIDYLEDEGSITMDELEAILAPYGIPFIDLNGVVNDFPFMINIFRCGLLLPMGSLTLVSGDVNDQSAPPKLTVSWSLFLGWYNMYDMPRLKLDMEGFAFGLDISSQSSGHERPALQFHLARLSERFPILSRLLL